MDFFVLWVPSMGHIHNDERILLPTKIKGTTWSTIGHSFFILNDVSKEKNVTFILKIPTRLTEIKFLMESPSLPFLSSAHTCTHTLILTLRLGQNTFPGSSWTSQPTDAGVLVHEAEE